MSNSSAAIGTVSSAARTPKRRSRSTALHTRWLVVDPVAEPGRHERAAAADPS